MTPDTLRAAGEALYGPRWQTDLARALDVADRTMRRWAVGAHPIPATLRDELVALLRARQETVAAALALIASDAPAGSLEVVGRQQG